MKNSQDGAVIVNVFAGAGVEATQPQARGSRDVKTAETSRSNAFDATVVRSEYGETELYACSETLTFADRATGRKVIAKLSEQPKYLRRIIERVGDDAHFELDDQDAPEITIFGNLATLEQARRYLVLFVDALVAANDFKKGRIDHLLTQVLNGAADTSAAKAPKPSKNGAKAQTPAVFSPATISVNELEPDSPNQKRYVKLLRDDKIDVVLTQGPAGTGKTRLFLQTALRKLREHYRGVPGANFSHLILSIPLVNVGGRDLGAMPGNLEKKTDPWYSTFYEPLKRILAPVNERGFPDMAAGEEALAGLMRSKIVQIVPLEFLRGKSFPNALICVDEAQNADCEQMTTFLTRAESTSRLFVSGDLEQNDRGKKAPLGEPFRVPSTVSIDAAGRVLVQSGKDWLDVGFYKDLGHFVSGDAAGTLDTVHPRNGFAEAMLLYSASPRIACTTFDLSDIRRSGVGFDLLALRRGLRVRDDDDLHAVPKGLGSVDPFGLLDEAAAERPRPDNKRSQPQIFKLANDR